MEKHEVYLATRQLQAVIRELGLKQKWVGERSGVAEATMSRICNRKQAVSRELAERVSALLHTPFFVLWELPKRSESQPSSNEEAA